jgi:hypothetical protein
MKSLTIVYTTGRQEPEARWFIDSLMHQLDTGEDPRIVIVDYHAHERGPLCYEMPGGAGASAIRVAPKVIPTVPKPTIWQGKHAVVREPWWAMSNARNTGICMANTEWIAFLDDRCVLMPTWLESIRQAMRGNYIVYGTYEKRHHMKVENGRITEPGTLTAEDSRLRHQHENPQPCDGGWAFGCTLAMPVDWVLEVGGFEQKMDGQSFEDIIFGRMLEQHGFPMRFDNRMKMVEDRTPGVGTNQFRREDKGKSPEDKSHKSLEVYATARHTTNREALLMSRQEVLAGRPWPVILDDAVDWFDGEKIDENYMKL